MSNLKSFDWALGHAIPMTQYVFVELDPEADVSSGIVFAHEFYGDAYAEAYKAMERQWLSREAKYQKRHQATGEIFDIPALKAEYFKTQGDHLVGIPMMFLFPLLRTMKLKQTDSVTAVDKMNGLKKILKAHGVDLRKGFTNLKFEKLLWSENPGQQPKIIIRAVDENGEPMILRFEATGEAGYKTLLALNALEITQGMEFSIEFDSKAARPNTPYIDHNVILTANGKEHNGKAFVKSKRGVNGELEVELLSKPGKFVQKRERGFMQDLFAQVLSEIVARNAKVQEATTS